MSLDKYFERIFKYMDKRDREKKPFQTVVVKGKRYCSNFSKGENGLCKHYMGCKIELVSCKRECGAN